jgi:hypothetical protein
MMTESTPSLTIELVSPGHWGVMKGGKKVGYIATDEFGNFCGHIPVETTYELETEKTMEKAFNSFKLEYEKINKILKVES